MHRLASVILILAFAFCASLLPAHAEQRIGLVLLHGKLGPRMGESGGRRASIGGRLIYDLKEAGYLVAAPEMCWSQARGFDRLYPDCLGEIDKAVAGLKSQGATAIVVGGLSMGGGAAIAYGALHPDLAGVIGFAPADDPVVKAQQRPRIGEDIASARSMVQQERADQKGSFYDYNTGPRGFFDITLHTTPRIYLSFFEPDALTNIGANTAKLRVPLLWIAGSADPTTTGRRAFDRASNPLNRYVTVSASHLEVPDAGASAVLAWLKELQPPH